MDTTIKQLIEHAIEHDSDETLISLRDNYESYINQGDGRKEYVDIILLINSYFDAKTIFKNRIRFDQRMVSDHATEEFEYLHENFVCYATIENTENGIKSYYVIKHRITDN